MLEYWAINCWHSLNMIFQNGGIGWRYRLHINYTIQITNVTFPYFPTIIIPNCPIHFCHIITQLLFPTVPYTSFTLSHNYYSQLSHTLLSYYLTIIIPNCPIHFCHIISQLVFLTVPYTSVILSHNYFSILILEIILFNVTSMLIYYYVIYSANITILLIWLLIFQKYYFISLNEILWHLNQKYIKQWRKEYNLIFPLCGMTSYRSFVELSRL